MEAHRSDGVISTGSIAPQEIAEYFNAIDIGVLAQGRTTGTDFAFQIKVVEYSKPAAKFVVSTPLLTWKKLVWPNIILAEANPQSLGGCFRAGSLHVLAAVMGSDRRGIRLAGHRGQCCQDNDRNERNTQTEMRILTVFGTRPEAIKMAPVIRSAREAGIETCVCVTAQHREMLDQVMEVFGLKADFDLDLMEENQSPLSVAARIFETLGPVIDSARPDWLLVQGDTTTTFAATFVGYHHRLRIGHIEAGLRTDNKWQPFPEEMNRRLVTTLTDLHFAPTHRAADALASEGVPLNRIHVTGNTVVDALQEILKWPPAFADPRLRALTGRIVLLTAHRREKLRARLEQICLAAKDILHNFPGITLVFPRSR